jgi:hypothetical protein
VPDDDLGPGVERLDGDASGSRLDPDFPAADDAVQAAFVPEVREVGAERAEPPRRELEVVRRRNAEDGQTRKASRGARGSTVVVLGQFRSASWSSTLATRDCRNPHRG